MSDDGSFQVIGIGLVWPIMVGGTGAATYFTVRNSDHINTLANFSFASTMVLSGEPLSTLRQPP